MPSMPALIDDEETLNQLSMSPTPSKGRRKSNQSQHSHQQQSQQSINDNHNNQENQALTLNSFQSLSSRFIEDVTSSFCQTSHSQFWNELLSSAQSLGFEYRYSETNDGDAFNKNELSSLSTETTTKIDFDSKEGKSHLEAVVSLLGVSNDTAKILTMNVMERIKSTSTKSSSTTQTESSSPPLLGTKKLLSLVRDYHYQQQISRIRFVTESLRHEAASNGNEKVQSSCIAFLDTFDNRSIGNGTKRGLFKILLSIACAPVRKLNRDEWYTCVALSDDDDGSTLGDGRVANANISANSVFYTDIKDRNVQKMNRESTNYFVKNLSERHEAHYTIHLRTEALEAMFMLLYNRIDGGINRGDYLLLLLAFDRHNFFVHTSSQNKLQNTTWINYSKCQSQLVALILAECMSLWHAIKSVQMNDSGDWIDTHPFLARNGNGDLQSVLRELNTIGELLLQKYAIQAEARIQRNFQSSNIIKNGAMQSEKDELFKNGDYDVPESIAILTFGVLIRLGRTSSESNWLSDGTTMDMSSKCVSVANDVIGAFDYLQIVIKEFLNPPSTPRKAYSGKNVNIDEKNYEFSLLMEMEQSKSVSIQTIEPEYNHIIEEEDESIVSYASIGREIVVGTLTAFQGSISTSTDLDTITMLCNLASMIYRNDDQMCSQFWSDWSTISEANCNNIEDPMNQLLYIAYQLAIESVPDDMVSKMASTCSARSKTSTLLALRPFMQLFSSLMTYDGNYLYLQNFLSNGAIFAALSGCYYLCSSDELNNPATNETLEAAAYVMKSLSSISNMIPQGNVESVYFLRTALTPTDSNHDNGWLYDNGCESLYKLAIVAHTKLLNLKQAHTKTKRYSSIICSCISIISSVINQSKGEDLEWIKIITSCLASDPNLMLSLSSSSSAELKLAYFELFHVIASNTLRLMMRKTVSQQTRNDFLKLLNDGATSAFEIILNGQPSQECHHCVYHAISTLDLLLKHLDVLASAHTNTVLQTNAKTLRNSIIDTLSAPTKLGRTICHFAIKPSSNQRVQDRILTHQYNADEEKRSEMKSFTGPSSENVSDVCAASLSLLLTWAQVAEHIAIDKVLTFERNSLEDIIDKLNRDDRSILSSSLDLQSPTRLFFCEQQQFGNEQRTGQLVNDCVETIMSAFCTYLSWSIEKKDDINTQPFALKAVKVIEVILRHFNLVKENYENTELHLRQVGRQVITTVQYYIQHPESIKATNDSVVVLYMLDILTSFLSLHVTLVNEIVESLLTRDFMNDILSYLKVSVDSSLQDILIASSCGKFLLKLYQKSGKKPNCQMVLDHLLDSGLDTISEMKPCLKANQDGFFFDHSSASKMSYLLKTHSYILQIIMLESAHCVQAGNRNKISRFESSMKKLSMLNLFQWFHDDLFAAAANANREFSEMTTSSGIEFSLYFGTITFSSIIAIGVTNGNEIAKQLKLLQACDKLIASETQFVSAHCVAFTFYDTCTSSTNDHEQVIQVAKLHYRLMQSYSLALPVLSSINHVKFTNCVTQMSKALSGYVVVSLAKNMENMESTQKPPIVMLELMMNLSNYGDETMKSSFTDVDSYQELRSNMVISVSLVIKCIMTNSSCLTTDEAMRYNKTRVKCCRLLCDTLDWLHINKLAFETEKKFLCLLQSVLNCMNLLVQYESEATVEGCRGSTSLATQMYLTQLLDTLHNSNAIPLLMSHLETSSNVLVTNKTKESGDHFDIISTILEFIDSLLQSECGYEVSQMLVHNHFMTSLIKNPVLQCTNNQASSSRKFCHRGYCRGQRLQHDFSDSESLVLDPNHEIWRSVLRVVASFTSSIQKTNRLAICSIIDFLKTYEMKINSIFHYFKYAHHQEFSLDIQSRSDHQFGYSIAILNESCDISAIMSELSGKLHRKQIVASSLQNVLQQFWRHSMFVIRSLSSFLGSIAMAREIFDLLNQFENVKDKDEEEILTLLYKQLASHPLLVEGIDKGRYEAFRLSQYANSCCVCVTKEDHELSRKICSTINQGNQYFHSQIQNKFLLEIESVASKCLFNALAVVSKNHPAATSFIHFNTVEAKKLNVCTKLKQGTVVAIRSKLACRNNSLAQLNNNQDERFARVIGYNERMRTFSVSYISKRGHIKQESEIEVSRLEGIEDPTKRVVCFRYEPANESCDQKQEEHMMERNSDGKGIELIATVGHLIQILQWCFHGSVVLGQKKDIGEKQISTKTELLRSIAEISMILLGNDLSLQREVNLQAMMNYPGREKINEQLLNLFGGNVDKSLPQKDSNSLQRLVDETVWNSVVNNQLSSALQEAKERTNDIARNRDQDQYTFYGRDEFAWRNLAAPKLSRRRSPFK